MAKISSVQDPITGSNYGGIRMDSLGMGGAQMDYLENLHELVRRPVSGRMYQSEYTPSADKSPVIGQVSNQTMGSLPIFGSGAAIFPQAILDNFNRARKQAEIDYLNEVGDVDMDTVQLSSALKNPWHNQAFSNKYQNALDTWLDSAAAQFGGDYMKGLKYLQGDREFMRMMKSYEDYANIYNSVFDSAVAILSADPKETYVSEETRKEAKRFIYDYEKLDELPIDELVRRARKFKTHVSLYKLAEMSMEGMGERIEEEYKQAYDMGTDELNVYKKKITSGPKDDELREIFDAQVDAYPWIKEDPKAQETLWNEIKRRADRSYKEAIETIKKGDADMTSYLKRSGVPTDRNGKVVPTPEAFTPFAPYADERFARGEDVIQYPRLDMNKKEVEIPTTSGNPAYIFDSSTGTFYYATLPGSYALRPTKEYSIQNRGRFVEGNIRFEGEGVYAKDEVRSTSKDGEIIIKPTGERSRQMTEKSSITVKDIITGNQVELFGNYQVVMELGLVKDGLHTAYPFLRRTHADMDVEGKIKDRFFPIQPDSVTTNTQPGTATNTRPPTDKIVVDDPNKQPDTSQWAIGQIVEIKGKQYQWNGSKLVRQ